MIPDNQTNFVYFSALLPKWYQEEFRKIEAILNKHGIKYGFLNGTKDIWCRDYMPIQIAKDRFVQFLYEPDYLKGEYASTITPPEVTLGAIPPGAKYTRSEIKVDGGNVVRWTDKAIMTDKVFKKTENPGSDRETLTRQLEGLLDAKELIYIRQEPYEPFGHSDGMVRFIDANTVLVNNYLHLDRKFGDNLLGSLHEHGLKTIVIPYNPQKNRRGRQSAIGCYINFLQAQGIILVPQFGLPEDYQALKTMQDAFPNASVIPVDCRDVAEEGGVLNCISWNILI